MDLTTTARVKTMAGISGTTRDTLIGVLVTAYSAEAERYLDRYVQSSSRTEVHYLPRFRKQVQLKGWPVGTLTSVTLSSSRDFTGGVALTEDASFVLHDELGMITLDDVPSDDPAFLQVVYTGGMAADQSAFTTAYPHISAAIDVQVIEHLRRIDNGTMEATASDAQGSVSAFGSYSLNKHTKDVLNSHRRVHV